MGDLIGYLYPGMWLKTAPQFRKGEALAKKYNADSFGGKFFHFNRWEEQVEHVTGLKGLLLRM